MAHDGELGHALGVGLGGEAGPIGVVMRGSKGRAPVAYSELRRLPAAFLVGYQVIISLSAREPRPQRGPA
jgi:hypothetical protein